MYIMSYEVYFLEWLDDGLSDEEAHQQAAISVKLDNDMHRWVSKDPDEDDENEKAISSDEEYLNQFREGTEG